jgi:fluoroquinolone resistance protein
MERPYITDKTFEKVNFTSEALPPGDYENCLFTGCDLSNADLGGIHFTECEFKSCNLSTAQLTGTAFKEVAFSNCKMLGLHFESCNTFLFEIKVDDCTLDLSSFYKLKMKKTSFKNASLREVDFSECDLSAATFDRCDLLRAVFDNTMLEKADFRTAYNYSIDPTSNKIKKAKFSLLGLAGLLDKFEIEVH